MTERATIDRLVRSAVEAAACEESLREKVAAAVQSLEAAAVAEGVRTEAEAARAMRELAVAAAWATAVAWPTKSASRRRWYSGSMTSCSASYSRLHSYGSSCLLFAP